MRSLQAIATDLRAAAPCIVGEQSAPCADCSLLIEAAEALEMIDRMYGVKLRPSPTYCDATHPDTECPGWIWCCSLIAGHLGPHHCAGAAW